MLEEMELREPKVIKTKGSGEVIISKFPALQGRKIMIQYPLSNMKALSDYLTCENVLLELLSYCEVVKDGRHIRLNNATLIDQHIRYPLDLTNIELSIILLLLIYCTFI